MTFTFQAGPKTDLKTVMEGCCANNDVSETFKGTHTHKERFDHVSLDRASIEIYTITPIPFMLSWSL